MKNLIIILSVCLSLTSCYKDNETYPGNPGNNQNPNISATVTYTYGSQNGGQYYPPGGPGNGIPTTLPGSQTVQEYYLNGSLNVTATPEPIASWCIDPSGTYYNPTYYYELAVYFDQSIYTVMLPIGMYQTLKDVYISAGANPDRVIIGVAMSPGNTTCGGPLIPKVVSIRKI